MNKPGWFLPGEIEYVAEYLNITVQELFDNHLGVDWWEAEEDVFVLAPATLNMNTGEEYPARPGGQCVFYKGGLCSIYHVKPYECKQYMHTDDKVAMNDRHKTVMKTWQYEQEYITELLGREPEAEEYGLFDFLLW